MQLRADQQRVKDLLSDTITLLCKNGLQYDSEFCVQALIGITLDRGQVFLVNINETISKVAINKRTQKVAASSSSPSKFRKRKASGEASPNLTNGTHSEDDEASPNKSQKIGGDNSMHVRLPLITPGARRSGKNGTHRRIDIDGPSPVSNHSMDTMGEPEVFDLSYKPPKDSDIHVIEPDPKDEYSQSHLVLDGRESEEQAESLGTGQPVWPEPHPAFAPSGAAEAEEKEDALNQAHVPVSPCFAAFSLCVYCC